MGRSSKGKEKDAARRKWKKEEKKKKAQEQQQQQQQQHSNENIKDGGVPALSRTAKRVRNMRRSITNMLKNPGENITYHECADFDVYNAILSCPKRQPSSNSTENFEEDNEPRLRRVTGNIVIIKDKHGVPCVIKAGNDRAAPLLPRLEKAILNYSKSRTIVVDHIRHGAAGTRERYKPNKFSTVPAVDATTLPPPEDNEGDAAARTKGCVIGHRAFVPRYELKTHDIELGPGPAQMYNKKPALKAMQRFAGQLRPLTKTVEAVFRAFLPEEYKKYKAVYDEIYKEFKLDPVDEAFGIWTSRSLVIDANTNNHKDLEDVCQGWCAIVALGDFEGGDACFPELGVKIDCPPGSVIFMRSYAVEHYIGSYVGTRYSVVHFTHQTVHDAYVQMTRKPLWEFSKMPEWWQKLREHMDV